MQRSPWGAGDPIPSLTQTETPDPTAVKLLNILVKFLAWDTWADPAPTRFPCCFAGPIVVRLQLHKLALFNSPVSCNKHSLIKKWWAVQMQFFTGRGVCFVFWLPWLPGKLLETVQPLLFDIDQRGRVTGPKKYVKNSDQIDDHHRLFYFRLQYQLFGSEVSLIFQLS